VLLLPSKLHHFAKEVGGCLCVNPGPLAKGAVGGTYACLDIHPMPAESFDMMDQDIELEHKVAARTAVEIFKI
jgi:DNA polymerase alpha subunit B